jgi:hypothetical protein
LSFLEEEAKKDYAREVHEQSAKTVRELEKGFARDVASARRKFEAENRRKRGVPEYFPDDVEPADAI